MDSLMSTQLMNICLCALKLVTNARKTAKRSCSKWLDVFRFVKITITQSVCVCFILAEAKPSNGLLFRMQVH